MTESRLYKIDKRVDEIIETISLCGDKDGDVLHNLELELISYIDELQKGLETVVNAPFKGGIYER